MSHLDALWSCSIHDLQQLRSTAQATSDDFSHVVGELRFDTPTTPAELAALERSCAWCFESHRVQLLQLFLARNCMRAVLLFRAPDAEAVRVVCRHLEMALEQTQP
jgi:hypothetical protein